MTTAALLALFAGVLAWPVPRLLAAARWPHRCPRAAIVLWQAIGLAGGVSALLAAIAFTVSPLSTNTPTAITDHLGNIAAGSPLTGLRWVNLVGLATATALACRLFGVLCASTAATLRERHRHRHLVDLAGRRHRGHGARESADHTHLHPPTTPASGDADPGDAPSAGGGSGSSADPTTCCLCEHRDRAGILLRILDHPIAVAYCVPGVRHARVVVSRGLLNTLDAAELDAVLAHEAAHVAGRHDLVIQPFVAWERTFPFLRPAREATAAVSLLVEMLADDAAARETSRRSLARALARLGVARAPVPAGALSIIGHPAAVLPALGAEDPLPATAARSAMQFGGGPGGSPAGGPAGATAAAVAPDAPGLRLGTANPVISRIARLLDPPGVHWWLPAGAYLAAAAVLAAPPVIVLIG
ncbi:M56 family metallopeptidase [Frankia sp. ACN1ag]|uniref:M56 family metallopeptidase n=1 Tax=Frankia sp. ACN1ag TaxID=102891 RepID=UPI0006DCFE43|nr:M56 family metallopeptidase [Frankia sp. ACN1ag]KQC35198.1 peptidase M48 [Frankia sp. ACN1ag]